MNTVAQTTAFFYTLTDAFCFVIIAILLYTALIDADRNRNRWHQINVMVMLMVFCLIEIVWILAFEDVILSRTIFARTLTNVLLYCSINACSFSMFLLLNSSLEKISKKSIISYKLPFAVFWFIMIVILSTPWTKLVFSISHDGVLHWGPMYIPFMIIIIGDLILSAVRSLLIAFHPENEAYKSMCILVALYAVPVFLGGYIHVAHYEVPSVAIGLTISILLFYVMQMREQVSIDDLTGINNRKQGERFFLRYIKALNVQQSDNEKGLYLFMADMNKFKSINDTYGHTEGDNALVLAAEALKDACALYADKCMLCRFGGDEFVIGGFFDYDDEADVFAHIMESAVTRRGKEHNLPYTLSISVGFARYQREYKTLKNFLSVADKRMYSIKRGSADAAKA